MNKLLSKITLQNRSKFIIFVFVLCTIVLIASFFSQMSFIALANDNDYRCEHQFQNSSDENTYNQEESDYLNLKSGSWDKIGLDEETFNDSSAEGVVSDDKKILFNIISLLSLSDQPISNLDNPDDKDPIYEESDVNLINNIDNYSDNENNYLTFTSQEDSSYVKLDWVSASKIQFSKNNEGWNDYSNRSTIYINNGETLMFRGNGIKTDSTHRFAIAGKVAASGDVTSLTNWVGGDIALSDGCYAYMFGESDCPGLISAPNLPSTSLAKNCYEGMFKHCEKLENTPSLPATMLAESCYYDMFTGCDSLLSAPNLPATTMANCCYQYMFSACESLQFAPLLPAGKNGVGSLADSCYKGMFSSCYSLVAAPELPATVMASNCYEAMFVYCNALNETPELPSTTLATYCYKRMFSRCSNLSVIPNLPATNLVQGCYEEMFCESPNITLGTDGEASSKWFITCSDPSVSGFGENMFNDTGGEVQGEPTVNRIYYQKKVLNPLSFVAQEDNSSVLFGWERDNAENSEFMYRLNNDDWKYYSEGCTITLNLGDKLQFKGKGITSTNTKHFCMSGKIAASGDVTSISNGFGGNAILSDACYQYLFRKCTSLTTAPNLPALWLTSNCYECMFEGCTQLTNIPDLHAESLAGDCYKQMFKDCYKVGIFTNGEAGSEWTLPSAYGSSWLSYGADMFIGSGGEIQGQPEIDKIYYKSHSMNPLTFTSLEDNSEISFYFYNDRFDKTSMFVLYDLNYSNEWKEYKSRTVIPLNVGDTVRFRAANYKMSSKFYITGEISAKGDITSLINAAGGVTELKTRFSNIFSDCDGLVSAPSLPSTLLSETDCYSFMFKNCENLVSAPELPATTLSYHCYSHMFDGCSNLINAPVLPATNLSASCYEYMFANCTKLSKAPELLAGKDGIGSLEYECYKYMFNCCDNLTEAPNLPATELKDYCYDGMFCECSQLVNSPSLPAGVNGNGKLASYCYSCMFKDCISLEVAPELQSITLSLFCYSEMFSGCKSLRVASKLPATNLAGQCYEKMYADCVSLVNAPVLPAGKDGIGALGSQCYSGMFRGCTSLVNAPELPSTSLTGCCYEYMFSGCKKLNSCPNLPASTLTDYCYYEMFKDCTSITLYNSGIAGSEWFVPCAVTSASNWGTNMFTGTGGDVQGEPELYKVYYQKTTDRPILEDPVVFGTNITLNWSEVPDATKYAVSIRKAGTTSWTTLCYDCTAKTYTIKDLEENVTYDCLVQAFLNGKWSTFSSSDIKQATTESIRPAAIATATGDGEITLSWAPIDGATKYAISEVIGSGFKEVDYNISGTSYVVEDLANKAKHTFLVQAFVNGKWSKYDTSNYVSATPDGNIKPYDISTVSGSNSIQLTWGRVSGASAYAVSIKKADGSYDIKTTSIKQPSKGVESVNYTVGGLSNSTQYTFLVQAFVNGSWSRYTEDDHVKASTISIKPQASAVATENDGEIKVSWQAVENATQYACSEYLGNGKFDIHIVGTDLQYIASDLVAQREHKFLVQAYVAGSWSSYTEEDYVGATPTGAIKPTNITTTPGYTSIQLDWDKVPGATKYAVALRNNDKTYKLLSTSIPKSDNPTFTASGLKGSTEYTFLVQAFVDGSWSRYVESDHVVESTISTKPQATAEATQNDGEIKVSWSPVENATQYACSEYLGDGKFDVHIVGTDLQYIASDLVAQREHKFLVQAYVAGGWSPYTEADFVGATPTGAVKPVATVTSTAETTVTVTWTAVTGTEQYAASISADGGSTFKSYFIDKGTFTYTFNGLTPNTNYKVLVQSKLMGKWNPYTTSDLVDAKTLKTKSAVAVYSETNSSLTFYYDRNDHSSQGEVFVVNNNEEPSWFGKNGLYKTVTFDASFADFKPVTTSNWFGKYEEEPASKLTTINGINYLDTSCVTNMRQMFTYCNSLTSLDVTKFNTTNVTDMVNLFCGCSKLTSLDVSKFNTSKVDKIDGMFSLCSGLTSLNVSNFDTTNVQSMEKMFALCSGLTSLDVSNFNTSKVYDMQDMFGYCTKLKELNIKNFNVNNVITAEGLFGGCSELVSIYCNSDWSKSTTLVRSIKMFDGCIKLPHFDSSKVDKTYAYPNNGTTGYFTAKA